MENKFIIEDLEKRIDEKMKYIECIETRINYSLLKQEEREEKAKEIKIKSIISNISFGSNLIVLFIGLKLLNKITWSWWWVLSPGLIPIIVGIISILIIIIIKKIRSSK